MSDDQLDRRLLFGSFYGGPEAVAEAAKRMSRILNGMSLAPIWHPLYMLDRFILNCGWTHETDKGFVVPETWKDSLTTQYGADTVNRYWTRENAIRCCVQFREKCAPQPTCNWQMQAANANACDGSECAPMPPVSSTRSSKTKWRRCCRGYSHRSI